MIRTATDHDAHAVAALERGNLGIDAWSDVLVAEADGAVVGHAVASIVGDVAELQRISVDRPHRRTGLATALLAAVRDLAVNDGADRLLLEVREDNAGAIAFYETEGFAEVGRRRHYYKDGATAVVLSLGLG